MTPSHLSHEEDQLVQMFADVQKSFGNKPLESLGQCDICYKERIQLATGIICMSNSMIDAIQTKIMEE
jgi:hypothetical protein